MDDCNISISVIIPVYNVQPYLRECLDSVVNQDIKNIEIICVDDCSTDGSAEILDEYKSRYSNIFVYKSEKNSGSAGFIRNIGMKYAKGEYLGFVDSDDFISTNYFNSLYTSAKKFDADISLNMNIIRFAHGESIVFKENLQEPEIFDTPEKREGQMVKTGSTGNKIYRKSFIEKYNLQCHPFRNVAEDNYFSFLSMSLANKIIANYDTEYYYRRHTNNITAAQRTKSDFNVITLYESIDKMLFKYISEGLISRKYLDISNKRKKTDFISFIELCHEDYLHDLKEQIKTFFPKVADNMGLTKWGVMKNFLGSILNLSFRILRKIYKILLKKS